ncbi:MBL fold metallo-hydrolase [Isoptericola sp. S6320L]|uniref:MBL fold metallo-hydrolase RNA specificity domain-containing protein n=1 Tax=Isoptericola sp. S6320L TaxID=2926411 RepID=UPI001FF5C649|nr:MBL fold metallo-hydrolase [Isoptericola sp. S6320L]MCK0118650.1 MBL fold metallo-hydrolase [Isoptericola sp. S6320L]
MNESAPVALTFLGAAGTVTGSRFLLELGDRRLLVDCGLYQGERRWRRMNWETFPVPPATIDGVVLTHCHLDHCGYLPVLVRGGYRGSVWMTEGTAALTAIVLRDSGNLQERDAELARTTGWSRHNPPRPLYTVADAERAIRRFETVPYDVAVDLGEDLGIRLVRAGHVLGSASVLVEAGATRVLFSGDLGRSQHPVLRPRAEPPSARTVVIESTYGDREHLDPIRPHAAFADAVRRTIRRGGVVLVPAFAVDRTELVLHALSAMVREGQIPAVPVYVDSPMALAVLDVYGRAEVAEELRPGASSLVDLPSLHAARTPEESKALNLPAQPCIIVSASGMASGGRVVHHLRHLLPDRRNCVVLTGYQSVGTRGRMLRDGARELKMMGRYVPVLAEVVEDEEFSVHADAGELIDWVKQMRERPDIVYVVHGEARASTALADRIRDEVGCVAVVPRHGERVLVD